FSLAHYIAFPPSPPTPPPQLYPLSLHDALPISGTSWATSRRRPAVRWGTPRCRTCRAWSQSWRPWRAAGGGTCQGRHDCDHARRSEEHTSELQSRGHLVCRLLLEKKKRISEPKK